MIRRPTSRTVAGGSALPYVSTMVLRRTTGFTLIELLTVVAILGMLAGGLAWGVANSRSTLSIDASIRQLNTTFSYVQTLGRGGRAYVGTLSDDATVKFDRGYGVHIAQGTNEIAVYGGAGTTAVSADSTYANEASRIVETQTMPGTVTVSEICDVGTLTNPETDACANSTSKLDVHFRRSERGALMFDDTGTLLEAARVTLQASSGETRTLVVNKMGLFYIVPL